MTTGTTQQVTFIQSSIPPLRDGNYVLDATQLISGQTPGTFSAEARFVVQGERFSINATEIDSVFPPNLANGELDGVLPHVVLVRRTLPWERTLDTPSSQDHHGTSPWLAVLVCDDATAPAQQSVTADQLVPLGAPITVFDTPGVTGTGKLVLTTLSYGIAVLGVLDYGETPSDPCTVIDLPIATFNQIAPAAADLQYLAHIREVDTTDGIDSDATSLQCAVVVGNRIPITNGAARAFLVSLEGMADYLPASDGTQSPAIGSTIDTVRLLVYRSWSFTTNDLDQTLEQLLAGLNGTTGITTLTLPIAGTAPTAAQVAQAMASQAAGSVATSDATVLMQNALLMGYVPLEHHLRHSGKTVSFYRGPLVPYAVPPTGAAYYSGPDAANAYDAQTGMFDVSYGAAWQLGQLLALQSAGMANQLYQWKRTVAQHQAMAAEESVFQARLAGAGHFPSLLAKRAPALDNGPLPLPPDVAAWFGNLAQLTGVPFNYLVPDERLLPLESIRLFYLDDNWLDALIDGAFSIGRAAVSGASLEAKHAPVVRRLARQNRGTRANNRRAADPAATAGAPLDDTTRPITGFLVRSAAVSGWPNLRIVGYTDEAATQPLKPIRVARLSSDTLLCLFGGVVASMYLREPPEQLHHGVEGVPGAYFATLRSVSGGPGPVAAGQQYPGQSQPITMRSDGRTVMVATAASALYTRLTTEFQQIFPDGFTSAELALELTKGVVEVEYRR